MKHLKKDTLGLQKDHCLPLSALISHYLEQKKWTEEELSEMSSVDISEIWMTLDGLMIHPYNQDKIRDVLGIPHDIFEQGYKNSLRLKERYRVRLEYQKSDFHTN